MNTILISLLVISMSFIAHAQVLSFPDVPSGSTYYDAVTYVQTEKIVQGFPDGTYGPDKAINRAEFTKIIVGAKFSKEEIDACTSSAFPDVRSADWFFPYVCKAKEQGIVGGFPDGTFGPSQPVKFVEAAKIFAGTFGGGSSPGEPWYKPFVEYLGSQAAIPLSITSFEKRLTRGEMAEMLYRVRSGVTSKPTRTWEQMSAVPAIRFERKEVQTSAGTFTVDMIMGDMSKGVKVITDAATSGNCDANCPAYTLKEYVERNNATAGIHGSYFCPPDYSQCADKINSFIYFVYANSTKSFVNTEKRGYDNAGGLFVFKQGSAELHTNANSMMPGSDITGAIAMWPALVSGGSPLPDHPMMDDKMRTGRGAKGGLGMKGSTVYLMLAKNATVPDLRDIMIAMGIENGINLDGGGSSALYIDGTYRAGPGRKLPNAVLLAQ